MRAPDAGRHRKLGFSVQYLPGKILMLGGRDDRYSPRVTNTAVLIDTTTGTPVVTSAAPMNYARTFHYAVMLPNGEVFVVGGNTSGEKFSDAGGVTVPEIWNTATLADDVDAVIVALGHNDFYAGAPPVARWHAAWASMLSTLPPRRVISWPRIDHPPPAAVVDAPWFPHQDRDGFFLEPPLDASVGSGCVWHPGTRSQRVYADLLVPLVKQALESKTEP